MDNIYTYLTVVLLLIQGCALQYCHEAVASVEVVSSCPTSKNELDVAAKRKNCGKLAASQNCSSFEDFIYHCTINSYRNATLEVCAPKRMILGHCTEFNIIGGVIQDQHSAKCNETFPKCDEYYISSDAYKYADCYKLAQSAGFLQTKITTGKKGIPTVNNDTEIVLTMCFGVVAIVVITAVAVAFVLRRKRNTTNSDPEKTKKGQRSNDQDLFQKLLLNGISTNHDDISNTSPNDMKNDTTCVGIVEINEECGTGSRSESLTSKRSSMSFYYDALDKQPEVVCTIKKYSPTPSKDVQPHLLNTTAAIDKKES